jgi:cysteine sulfinate desulfinase/cysteine desulfurase-like protein
LIIGGHQEEGNRGGTENVPYIVAFDRSVAATVRQIAFSFLIDPALVGFHFPI